MTLDKYRAKRDFSLTNEPQGGNKIKKGIFVIQFHEASHDHYDLRLEHGGVLLSWAVPKGPSLDPKVKRLAVMVEDHPIEYADFEGEIPLGQYGGGMVTIYDKGKYAPKVDFDVGLKEGSLKFTLFGNKLGGGWALVRTEGKNWLLIKEKDDFCKEDKAKNDKDMDAKNGAVKQKKTSKGISESLVKSVLDSVKRAEISASIPSQKDWLFEVKYDGYRIMAVSSPTRLLTRNGNDMSEKFGGVARAIDELTKGHDVIFDGEVAAIRNGRIDFSALSDGGETTYFIFDLLYYDGDMRSLPLSERKNKLRRILKNATTPIVYVKSYLDGTALFEAVGELNMEGIVCKKKNATYFEKDWLKVKIRKRQEFVVCGYLGEDEIRSLLLGVYDGERLTYVGKVGSGISKNNTKTLKEAFEPFATKTPSLPDKISGAHWLTPSLMAEVEFAEWTKSGTLRQPAFKGLRNDKPVRSVKIETPHTYFGVTITHPDKAVFLDPNFTKADIANYYENVAKRMLPFLKGRPISVLRCNDGIDKPFFVKHPLGKKDELIYIDSREALMNEVQLGTVEFHIMSSAGETFFMVFDLDPDSSLDLDLIRRCTLDIRATLSKLKIKSYLKTSGGKGFHVVAPMPPCPQEEFAGLARSIAELVTEKSELYTLNIKKDKRQGKIFIDWQRNSPSATAVAPYSLRARKGAPVSMPIAWNKLDSTSPSEFNILSPIKNAPWKNFFD